MTVHTKTDKMLTIKRIPTVVSINDEDGGGKGCGRDCLGACCIAGANLPLYEFGGMSNRRASSPDWLSTMPNPTKRLLLASAAGDSDYSDSFSTGSDSSSDESESGRSLFDTVLLAAWDDRFERGLFRYDVTACPTKVLEGSFGFVAQLNVGRHSKKRPTEFRVDKVLQEFDSCKFNFTKASQQEALFQFAPYVGTTASSVESRYLPSSKALQGENLNVILINVSPIEYGHVLLVPCLLECIPQQLSESALLLAVRMAVEADNPFFRVGYNSLGAFATINHLHFQAYYLAVPFAIERATVSFHLGEKAGGKGSYGRHVRVGKLVNYPVKVVVFEAVNQEVEAMVAAAAAAAEHLQSSNMPFNVLIANRGRKIFFIPQCFAEKQAKGQVAQELLDTQVNPAVWEISGHMVLKRESDYVNMTEAAAAQMLSEVSLGDEAFERVLELCIEQAKVEWIPWMAADAAAVDGTNPPSIEADTLPLGQVQ
eukprot:TRINITY_DN9371_c0_g1_i1.p1 TRINITY_DN9371_c0_g1~~TRINITY_DN9371_c0_g1_i1.p1  ORF type:complete len:483 (+),score=143.75 TRINITY_DN9371_c0_g1_i1:521-1969(+)